MNKSYVRRVLPSLFLAIMILILSSCSNNDLLNGELSNVSVSESNGFSEVNSNFIHEFDDQDSIEVFEKAISTAVQQEGVVDMPEPEFDLEVTYTKGNKQGFHLWLGEKGNKSTIMSIYNTQTIYYVSEKMTDELVDLLD